jgi:hypothetical protein
LAYQPANWYDDKAGDPSRITALANLTFQTILQGYYYRHVQAIIVATDQYSEAALEVAGIF